MLRKNRTAAVQLNDQMAAFAGGELPRLARYLLACPPFIARNISVAFAEVNRNVARAEFAG